MNRARAAAFDAYHAAARNRERARAARAAAEDAARAAAGSAAAARAAVHAWTAWARERGAIERLNRTAAAAKREAVPRPPRYRLPLSHRSYSTIGGR